MEILEISLYYIQIYFLTTMGAHEATFDIAFFHGINTKLNFILSIVLVVLNLKWRKNLKSLYISGELYFIVLNFTRQKYF